MFQCGKTANNEHIKAAQRVSRLHAGARVVDKTPQLLTREKIKNTCGSPSHTSCACLSLFCEPCSSLGAPPGASTDKTGQRFEHKASPSGLLSCRLVRIYLVFAAYCTISIARHRPLIATGLHRLCASGAWRFGFPSAAVCVAGLVSPSRIVRDSGTCSTLFGFVSLFLPVYKTTTISSILNSTP